MALLSASAVADFENSVAMEKGEDTFYLEQVTIEEDDNDGLDVASVSLGDDDIGDDGDEDLDQAFRTMKLKQGLQVDDPPPPLEKPVIDERTEVVDDFIRNFLRKVGLQETLDVFQREWYKLEEAGQLKEEDVGIVPDVYLRNQYLRDELHTMKQKMADMEAVANKARATWDRFRKERDFHRMHHRRVVQEKNRVVTDLKRVKNHYADYEPTLMAMRKKYEAAMKEKTMMKLERDRLRSQVATLEAQVAQLEAIQPKAEGEAPKAPKSRAPGAVLPRQPRPNPMAAFQAEPRSVERFSVQGTNRAHDVSVVKVAHHPTKPVVATASDDSTWKMFTVPEGELIMSGEGHADWLSSVAFHPTGAHLATSSGDGTVKLWDFKSASCSATFTDHTQAVWDVAWHDLGDFLVSASMDHTAKLWDSTAGRCRGTLRGHVDSVNAVCFQPVSEIIATAGGDKTISLWDCRSSLCVQTFYGHMNACNNVCFSSRGDHVASVDADGVVKVWDVRKVCEARVGLISWPPPELITSPMPRRSPRCATSSQGRIRPTTAPLTEAVRNGLPTGCAPRTAEACELTPPLPPMSRAGSIMAVASDDGTIKVFNVVLAASNDPAQQQRAMVGELRGHDEAVLSLCLEPTADKYLVSSSSDTSYRIWS